MNNLTDILNIDATTQTFKKGTILQRQGDINSKAFYVKNGLLRSFTIDEKGKEHNFMFGCEGWIVADVESQEFHHPAELFIDCLENTEVIIFDRKHLTSTNVENAKLVENIKLLSKRIGVMQKRVLMLMSATAKERYEHFLQTYPELPNRVPQKMIASYLGITPEALSNIRSKMNAKKQ